MKDPFNIFIEESVYYATNKYYKMMFDTKLIFFDYLHNGKSNEEFRKKIDNIWKDVDHTYMKQRIEEFEKMVSAKNTAGHKIINENAKYEEIFKINPESKFIAVETKYANDIEKYYKFRLGTLDDLNIDKNSYISLLVDNYDEVQQTIPYYNKDGTVRAYHNVASYNSMLYNVNMNRSGWNRTMYDSKLLNNDLTYLPAHPFACPLCMPWQGKIYSISGKSDEYPNKQVAIDGGIGHPNCKHQWTLYWSDDQLQKDIYNSANWEDKYQNKQKLQAAELQRSKLKVDRKIYESLGNYEKVDKTNLKIQALNKKVKNLK